MYISPQGGLLPHASGALICTRVRNLVYITARGTVICARMYPCTYHRRRCTPQQKYCRVIYQGVDPRTYHRKGFAGPYKHCGDKYEGQHPYIYNTAILLHGCTSPAVTCTRVYILAHVTVPLAVICTRFLTLVHITVALVWGNRPPALMCTRVNTLVHITPTTHHLHRGVPPPRRYVRQSTPLYISPQHLYN